MSNVTYLRQYNNVNQREAVVCFMDTLYRFNICKMSYIRLPRKLQVEFYE